MNTPFHPAARGFERLRPFCAFVRWRTLAASRTLARESVGTLQGRLLLLISVLALPGLFSLLTSGGPIVVDNLDDVSRTGALFLGGIGLELGLLAMVPVLAAKSLVLTHDADPVSLHGGFRPHVAVFRVAVAVFGTSAFLALFFTLVQGSLLPSRSGGGFVGRLALFGALTLQLVLPGVLAAEAVRGYLAGSRVLRRAEVVYGVAAAPFFALFPAFVWLPVLVERHARETLDRVGRVAAEGLALVQPGIGLFLGGAEGRSLPVFGYLALLAAGLLGSGWALARWLESGPTALCCPEGGPQPSPRPRMLPWGPRPTGRRSLLALFLWKDAFVERSRRPFAYLALHTLLLGATCLLTLEVASRITVLAASAGLSMPSLAAMGREGPAVTLVRLALGPARMFTMKWAAGCVEAAAHLPFHALAIAIVSGAVSGAGTLGGDLLARGLVGCLLFSLVGTGLGFLVPDPRRRSFLLPGASRAGQALYLSFAGPLVVALA